MTKIQLLFHLREYNVYVKGIPIVHKMTGYKSTP